MTEGLTVRKKIEIFFQDNPSSLFAVHEIPFTIVGASQVTVAKTLRMTKDLFDFKWILDDKGKRKYKAWQLKRRIEECQQDLQSQGT